MKTSICTNGFSIFISTLLLIFLYSTISCDGSKSDKENSESSSRIIDHTCTDITYIPESAINQAKTNLHIGYGHTSHGSQLTGGMTGLLSFKSGYDTLYAFNNGGTGGALDLHDYAMGGDCGYYPAWEDNTRDYLGTPDPATGRGTGSNADVNLIIWSWCGQVSSKTEETMLSEYLTPMSQFEVDYPGITFVYMTGHLDGGGLTGNLHIRNEQIRNYCRTNNKWLFDFADIESYDPDGNYFGNRLADDACNYDADNDGVLEKDSNSLPINGDHNWAIDWQNSHAVGVDWYNCSTAHSQPLNGNRKAYAAWWLWARLGGWSGAN